MLPQTQNLSSNLPPPILPTEHLPKPPLSAFKPITKIHFRPIKATPFHKFSLLCSISEPTSTQNETPFPAEVSRTIMELSSVGTLSALGQENQPLGIGVRFAVDHEGSPVLCLNDSNRSRFTDKMSSLHVQLEQCGLRTPQCTIQGILEKPDDRIVLKKLHSLWNKRFGEDADEDLIHFVAVERVLHIEDFAEDGVWITSSDYKLANPDPVRDFAKKIVDEINAHNMEDVYRFCNIYVDLDFQVSEAKVVWVDRLGFDMHIKSLQNELFEVRIPFAREVSNEKEVKSSFNCMSQLAWEVEKNFQVADIEKVKRLKKIKQKRTWN